jgi:hypothetical protein
MKKSVLDKLQQFKSELEKENFSSHFLVGVDITEDGAPNASMMISCGKPFETIGMIDVLILNLQDTKKDILRKVSQKKARKVNANLSDTIEKAVKGLPKNVRDRVIDIKKRLDEALKNGDQEALEKIKQELQQLKHDELGDDKDDGNFDITDFKGGLA